MIPKIEELLKNFTSKEQIATCVDVLVAELEVIAFNHDIDLNVEIKYWKKHKNEL